MFYKLKSPTLNNDAELTPQDGLSAVKSRYLPREQQAPMSVALQRTGTACGVSWFRAENSWMRDEKSWLGSSKMMPASFLVASACVGKLGWYFLSRIYLCHVACIACQLPCRIRVRREARVVFLSRIYLCHVACIAHCMVCCAHTATSHNCRGSGHVTSFLLVSDTYTPPRNLVVPPRTRTVAGTRVEYVL